MIQVPLLDGIGSSDSFVRLAVSEEDDEIVDSGSVKGTVFSEEEVSGKVQSSRCVCPTLLVLVVQGL